MLTNENQTLVLRHLHLAEEIAKSQFRKTPPQVQTTSLNILINRAKELNTQSNVVLCNLCLIAEELVSN